MFYYLYRQIIRQTVIDQPDPFAVVTLYCGELRLAHIDVSRGFRLIEQVGLVILTLFGRRLKLAVLRQSKLFLVEFNEGFEL